MSRSLSRVILPSLLASRVWSLVLFYYGRYFIIIIWQICVADILDVDIRLNYQFCLATDPGRWERCIPSASVSIAGRLNFSHYVRNLGEIEKVLSTKVKSFRMASPQTSCQGLCFWTRSAPNPQHLLLTMSRPATAVSVHNSLIQSSPFCGKCVHPICADNELQWLSASSSLVICCTRDQTNLSVSSYIRSRHSQHVICLHIWCICRVLMLIAPFFEALYPFCRNIGLIVILIATFDVKI